MSNSTQCILNANPDICGIGVRVSIYVQAFLDLILTVIALEHEQLATTVRTTLLTAASLIISAFVQYHMKNGLSLFEAIVVTELISIKLASVIQFPRTYITCVSLAIFQPLYVTFTFWVWSRVGQFGSQPDCNGTIVWGSMFGHTIHAPDVGLQIVTLLYNCLVTLYTILFLAEFVTAIYFSLPKLFKFTGGTVHERLTWPDGVNFGQLGIIIYLIIMTEQTLGGNNVQYDQSQWTFGQTLAVLLVFPSLFEVCERALEILKLVKGNEEKDDPMVPADVEDIMRVESQANVLRERGATSAVYSKIRGKLSDWSHSLGQRLSQLV
jgi:hypothetical protein